MSSDTPLEWIEANDEANEWYYEFTKFYTDPINLIELYRNPYLE
jgi:hypothetical protein